MFNVKSEKHICTKLVEGVQKYIPMTNLILFHVPIGIVKRFNTLPDSSKYTPNYHWYLHTNNKDSDQAESTLQKKPQMAFYYYTFHMHSQHLFLKIL